MGVEFDYTRFVVLSRHRLYREACLLCRDPNAAEDLIQITLFKLFLRWPMLEDRDRLIGYARQVMRRAHLDDLRLAYRRREILSAEVPDLCVEDEDVVDRITVATVVGSLPRRQREIVELRYLRDYSVKQTAAVLGCPTGTVTAEAHRAISALRRICGGDAEPRGR